MSLFFKFKVFGFVVEFLLLKLLYLSSGFLQVVQATVTVGFLLSVLALTVFIVFWRRGGRSSFVWIFSAAFLNLGAGICNYAVKKMGQKT